MTGWMKPTQQPTAETLEDIPKRNKIDFKTRHWFRVSSWWVRFALLVLTIFVLFVLRRPDALTNPQFWAEGGTIFFRDQLLSGGFDVIFTPYAGYLHPIPRLMAMLASLFPIVYAPLIYNTFALVIASICCSLFFLPRYRGLISSDWLRLLLCLLAAGAFYTQELIGTIISTQWYLLLVGVLLLSRPPEMVNQSRLWVACVWTVVGFGVGFSSPMLVVGFPLSAWQMIKKRGRALVPAALMLGAVIQTLITISDLSQSISSSAPSLDQILLSSIVSFTYRVFLDSILGHPLGVTISETGMAGVVLMALLIAAVWFTWLWVGLNSESRRRMAAALYLMFVPPALFLFAREYTNDFAGLTNVFPRHERYFFLSCCMLAYLAALTLEHRLRWTCGLRMCLVLTAVFAGGILGNFKTRPFVDFRWPDEAQAIERWYHDAQIGRPTPELSIPINPPPWRIELPSREN